MPGGTHEGGVVGVVAVGDAIGGLEDVAAESLRRLRRGELVAVDGADDSAPVDPLDRVDDGKHRERALATGLDRVDDALEHGGRRQRARCVMDEHDLDVAPRARRARGRRTPGASLPPVTTETRSRRSPGGLERRPSARRPRAREARRRRPARAVRRRPGSGHAAGCCAHRCRRRPWARLPRAGCPIRRRRR